MFQGPADVQGDRGSQGGFSGAVARCTGGGGGGVVWGRAFWIGFSRFSWFCWWFFPGFAGVFSMFFLFFPGFAFTSDDFGMIFLWHLYLVM